MTITDSREPVYVRKGNRYKTIKPMKFILPLAAIPWFAIGSICAALAGMPVLCIALAMAAIFFAFVVAIKVNDEHQQETNESIIDHDHVNR